MRSLNIYVSDDTEERIITISSNAKFSTAKMKKEDVKLYGSALDYPGVYMLLIGEDSVYVGMSDLDSVQNRIMNTHSGTIDSDWHTVIGFLCNSNLSTNEYRFLENIEMRKRLAISLDEPWTTEITDTCDSIA